MAHPEWVLAFRNKGQEIKKIAGNYYLYEVSSYYDKESKRSIKKSGKMLGRITETGLLTQKNRLSGIVPRAVSIREYGASEYIRNTLVEEKKLLEKYFPNLWGEILVCSIFRLLHKSVFKQMNWYYESSFLYEEYPNLALDGKQISKWLVEVGEKRDLIVKVMAELQDESELLLLDSTHIKSLSKRNLAAQIGYNSQRSFDTQVNLLYLFAQNSQMPIFYRCVQGSVREVRSLELTLKESARTSAVLVADKGFYSAKNIKMLEQGKWQFVIPLRRSSKLIDYASTMSGDKKIFDGHFIFQKRIIWYRLNIISLTQRIILFFDESLKVSETQDYLLRLSEKKKNYTIEKFTEKEKVFGTISIITNTRCPQNTVGVKENHVKEDATSLDLSAIKVFEYYKSRNEIEQLNDSYKNVLEGDRTYMQTESTMESWNFINFLAIRAYYRLFATLCQKELKHKYSPADILLVLQCKKKIKLNGHWIEAEIPKKTQIVLNQIFSQQNPK